MSQVSIGGRPAGNGSLRRHILRGGAMAGAALALAACGPLRPSAAQRPVEGPKEVIWSGTNFGEPREGYWRETFRAAEQATGIKITPLFEAGVLGKRQAEFAAGTTNADLMSLNLNQHISLGLDGMLLDLADYLRRDKVDVRQYYKADFESWSWKDKHFAMPWASGGVCVLYNRRLFDERGVKYPAKDWTYDDLLQLARRFTDSSGDRYGLHVQQNLLNYMMGSFVYAFGGKLLNDAKDRPLYHNDANTLRAVEFNVELHTRHKVAIAAEGLSKLPQGTTPMDVGVVPMEMNGIFRHSALRVSVGDQHLDFAPFPRGPAGQRAAVAGNAWGILKLSQAKDAAWRVLSWTHTRDGMLKTPQMKGIAWPPLIWAAAPEWQELFKGSRIAEVTKVWETGGHDILPLPEINAWTVMNAPINKALAGEVTPRNALSESAQQLSELFAQRPARWK